MGHKVRRKSSVVAIPECTEDARPLFTDDAAERCLNFTGIFANLDMPYKDRPERFYYSVSKGWCFNRDNTLYWSYWQAFKYRLRKLLRLPVESDDPRELVSWRWRGR